MKHAASIFAMLGEGEAGELRLRVGDYHVRFTSEADETIRIHAVRHRREAYR